MNPWLRRVFVAMLVLANSSCGAGEQDEVADLRRQVEALKSQAAATSSAPTALPTSAPPADPAATADCVGLKALGFTRDAMLKHWYTNGRPDRLDGDRDGVPCDITFPEPAAAQVAVPPQVVPPAGPAAAKQPSGVLELLRFNNDIEYSDTCAHVILFFANRSDTAVSTAAVHFHGSDAPGRKIDLGTRLVRLGLAPYQENRYDVRVCDDRMGGQESGPAAIPDNFTWEWFT